VTILSRLNRYQRITLILFVILLADRALVFITNRPIPGNRLLLLFFIVSLILSVIVSLRPLVRRLLWRVRTRLLVTYFLIGALPIVLLLILVYLGFYLVLSQTANYLLHAEIDRRLEQLHNYAQQQAEDVSTGKESPSSTARAERTIVRTPGRAPADFPAWSTPGFRGVLKTRAGTYFFAAHGSTGSGQRAVEVFAYRALDNPLLADLMPRLGSVYVVSGAQVSVRIGPRNPNARVVLDSEEVAPAPPARGSWDSVMDSVSPLNVRMMDDGQAEEDAIGLVTRPSALLATVFSTLGPVASVLGIFMLVTAIAFLVVEIVAITLSVQLTRTITRTIHNLYLGTKRVESGDFSHRVPIRTKDQLSELGISFNSMTSRIEQLIVEAKEKEKLESELEIARQVQAQLFPKEAPKLETLELAGVCKPARIVSGDYYDFIPIGQRQTAIIIGDISGKGISAALLMASVQSALHAQLTMDASEVHSTATLVSRLNRQLYENTPPEKYATFYCGLYDNQSGRLCYTNAGHLAPMIIRGANVTRLESNGTVMGLFPDFPFEQSAIDLERGDLLAAFTDGITESENKLEEQFGDARLLELLIRHRHKPVEEILRIVGDAVRDWAHDLDNQDDITMLLARRL
jgi:sigma-B regulation protein RsbU (phosphoserine phosphatase)